MNQDNKSSVIKWLKLISLTGGSQAIVQISALLVGIVIIRLLNTTEYALYTIANAVVGTMTLIADGGITSGVMAEGGKVWQDKHKLGIVFNTGFQLRKKFGIVTLIVALPILFFFLKSHKSNNTDSFLVILALIPSFIAAISDSLYETILKLHQDIRRLQANQIMVSLLRLVLSSFSLIFFPLTVIALIANTIPRIIGNLRLKKRVASIINLNSIRDKEVENRIVKLVKRILPTTLYYSVSSQITIWLISIFGKTDSIAEIGAISRFSMMLNLISVVFATLFVPRFSRASSDKSKLMDSASKTLILLFITCISVVLVTLLFSKYLLLILGPKYAGLNEELVLSMTGGCISLLAGTAFSLYSSRGWMINPVLSILIDILAITAGILIFNVSSLKGVLFFNILTSGILFLSNVAYLFYCIKKQTANERTT